MCAGGGGTGSRDASQEEEEKGAYVSDAPPEKDDIACGVRLECEHTKPAANHK